MKCLSYATAISLLLAGIACGQDWAKEQLEASPRHGEWVQIEYGDRTVDAFVVYPEVAEKATAVIVIHEIFGLTDWVRNAADQFAAAGYIAIAPDLLSEMGPDKGNTASFDGETVRRAIMELPPDQITADLDAAVDYVVQLPACNGKFVVTGFCWGGSQTFRYATNNTEMLAAFPFYGTGPTDEEGIARIECPVHGFYGENDARVNATIDQSKELMKNANKEYTATIYDGAGHGFMRAGEAPDASAENAAARKAAWVKIVDLINEMSKE